MVRRGKLAGEKIKELVHYPDWKEVISKDEVKVYSRSVEDGKQCIKGEGIIKGVTPIQIKDYLGIVNI